MFIVIDGPDFTGKSTVISLVAKKLEALGLDVVTCNDPSTELSIVQKIRSFLLGYETRSKITEMLLFCACRAELNEKIINPALKENKVVLCDRYVASTVAYQIFGNEGDRQLLYQMTDSEWTVRSDFTFFLTVNQEARAARVAAREDKIDVFDVKSKEFFDRVNEGYEFCFDSRIGTKAAVKIDTSDITPDDVATLIVKALILSGKR